MVGHVLMASRRSSATFVAQARSAAEGACDVEGGSRSVGLRGESPSGSAIGLGISTVEMERMGSGQGRAVQG